jgi:peptidoglycan/LPS O-acetylase OafA/YrhL
LRAVAVSLVVGWHVWPLQLPGGFVGVDIFFVISGYLITAHLLREVTRTGSLRLGAFWARRARRLLPASLLVLAVTSAAVSLWAPETFRMQFFKELAASVFYIENWVLAADSVDYLNSTTSPSPAQHFWSLSVEEQFYLIWPLLVLALAFFTKRLSLSLHKAGLAAFVVVGALSLAASVTITASSPTEAYFVTTTRAWEFAAGGILALMGVSRTPGSRTASVVSIVGWASILVSAVAFSTATPFPGSAALLPVLGTVAVIWSGARAGQWPSRLFESRPVRFVGDSSYSIYLWHWPVLVVLSYFVVGDALWIGPVIVIVTLILAFLTTRCVELPVRERRWPLLLKTRSTLIAALVAMLVVGAPPAVAWLSMSEAVNSEQQEAAARASSEEACFGAASVGAVCDPGLFETLTPSPATAQDDDPAVYEDNCVTDTRSAEVTPCHFGDEESDTSIALVGDSHAAQWSPALIPLAQEHGWSVTTYLKSACPQSTAENFQSTEASTTSCRQWNAALGEELRGSEAYDFMIVAYSVVRSNFATPEAAIAGFRDAWQEQVDRGTRVIVLKDIPLMPEDVNQCLIDSVSPESCGRAQDDALAAVDLMVEAAHRTDGVDVIDMTDFFCWLEKCNAAIGGVTIYRDSNHFTATYARTLAPALFERLESAGLR